VRIACFLIYISAAKWKDWLFRLLRSLFSPVAGLLIPTVTKWFR